MITPYTVSVYICNDFSFQFYSKDKFNFIACDKIDRVNYHIMRNNNVLSYNVLLLHVITSTTNSQNDQINKYKN